MGGEGKAPVMERRSFMAMLTGGVVVAPLAVDAQPAAKIARIGYLGRSNPAFSHLAFGGRGQEQEKHAPTGLSRIDVLGQRVRLRKTPKKALGKKADGAARGVGVQVLLVEARGPAAFDRAFSEMTRARALSLS